MCRSTLSYIPVLYMNYIPRTWHKCLILLFKKPKYVKDDYISTNKFYIIISTCLGNALYLGRFDREEIKQQQQQQPTKMSKENTTTNKQTKIFFFNMIKNVDTCI